MLYTRFCCPRDVERAPRKSFFGLLVFFWYPRIPKGSRKAPIVPLFRDYALVRLQVNTLFQASHFLCAGLRCVATPYIIEIYSYVVKSQAFGGHLAALARPFIDSWENYLQGDIQVCPFGISITFPRHDPHSSELWVRLCTNVCGTFLYISLYCQFQVS